MTQHTTLPMENTTNTNDYQTPDDHAMITDKSCTNRSHNTGITTDMNSTADVIDLCSSYMYKPQVIKTDTNHSPSRWASRYHCLNIVLGEEVNKDNGIDFAIDPSIERSPAQIADTTISFASPSSSKAIIMNGIDASVDTSDAYLRNHLSDTISCTDRDKSVDVGGVLMRALAERDAQVEARFNRLEVMMAQLLNTVSTNGIADDIPINQIKTHNQDDTTKPVIQISEKRPNKIIIQYFNNKGKHGRRPTMKLELLEQKFSKARQSYYAPYQTLHGYCYDDFGLDHLNEMAAQNINQKHSDAIERLSDVLTRAKDTDLGKEAIGTYFYDCKSDEVFTGAFAFINIDNTCVLSLDIGDEFNVAVLCMSKSKARSGHGIYIINRDKLERLFNGDDV